MMSADAIQVEGLGKRYTLRHQLSKTRRYDTLREAIARNVSRMFQRTDATADLSHEEFWALRDVSFSVREGEAIGIIGRNGAGKSTLLKLLSRIAEPTTGRIELTGRVASLLEVGTGFHPELTGRENVFLNGAILGMSRAETKSRFDEIVEFAEVAKFLDTPVKHYSSGMYMRLAFSVAAHLEPDILIVDEVLAVGDTAFQQKCLGKMDSVTRSGRTVLFVSHNMAAIERMTTSCLLLSGGKLEYFGNSRDAVSRYLDSNSSGETESIVHWKDRSGNGAARVTNVQFLDGEQHRQSSFRPTQSITVRLTVEATQHLPADIGVVVENEIDQPLFATHLSDSQPAQQIGFARSFEFEFEMTPNFLRVGRYKISIALFRPDRSVYYDVVRHFPAFHIEGEGIAWSVPYDERWGNLYLPFVWKARKEATLE